jgi:hypothetical protein
MKKFAMILGTVILVSCSSVSAAVKLSFSQSQMDAFTVQGSSSPYTVNNLLGPNVVADTLTPFDKYSDDPNGMFPMTGMAGATGYWPSASVGSTVDVDLGLEEAGILAQFGTYDFTALSGGIPTTLAILAINDDDDIWGHDLWIRTLIDGIVSTPITDINSGSNAILTLDISSLDLTHVLGIGVSVHGDLQGAEFPSGGDSFHSSWSTVPEPTTSIIWAVMGLSAVCFRPRRR